MLRALGSRSTRAIAASGAVAAYLCSATAATESTESTSSRTDESNPIPGTNRREVTPLDAPIAAATLSALALPAASEFELWKKTYAKSYATVEDEAAAQAAYASNDAIITPSTSSHTNNTGFGSSEKTKGCPLPN